MKETTQVKLTILTPLHIGSGTVASPYTDYVYHDGYLHYISQEKLMTQLNGEQLEDFIENVYTDANTNNKEVRQILEAVLKLS